MKRIRQRMAAGFGAVAIAAAGLAGLGGAAQAVPGFKDVPANHQQYADIVWLANSGITTGYGDGTFRPSAPVNRDAFAAFLYRMAGSPAYTPPATPRFRDVPQGRPFYKEISWLASTGITTGWADGTFRPSQPITRDAMAAFMYRFACEPFFNGMSGFRDVSLDHPFLTEIAWMRQAGVSTGWSDNTYRPANRTERGAMAAFLHRFAQKGIKYQPSCTKQHMDIENDPAYASIEGTVRLNTTAGSGAQAKLVMASAEDNAGGVTAFEIYYEKDVHHAYKQFSNNTVFLVENIDKKYAAEPGSRGKDYGWLNSVRANRDTAYAMRLSYYPADNTIRMYVNGKEVNRRPTHIKPNTRVTFAIEGSVAHGNDSIDAIFDNVKVKAGNREENYGVIQTWNPGVQNGNSPAVTVTKLGSVRTDGPFQTDGNAIQGISFRVNGVSKAPAGIDWDTAASRGITSLSGVARIAQAWWY